MRQKYTLTVVNMTWDQICRAGFFFEPKAERTVEVTSNGRAEIKACGALVIYTPGLACDQPDCGFVGKNERSLDFHKKRVHQGHEGGEEDE